MKTTFSARFMQRMALTTALCAAFISTAHADDLNIKTMIPGVPQIDAESYILIDYNSGKVLAEQNADERRDPASLTKMMTSYVIGQAMKAGKFKETDLVTVGNDAWATGNPVFKGSSLMFLKPGMQVPVSQLIRGINLQSGNDACVAMADFAQLCERVGAEKYPLPDRTRPGRRRTIQFSSRYGADWSGVNSRCAERICRL